MNAFTLALPAALLGLTVWLLFRDPMLGIGLGLGLVLGGAGTLLFNAALRAGPARSSGAAISDAAVGWAEFHRELARARRFDRPFAIIRFSVDALPGLDAVIDLRNEIAASSRRFDRLWIDEDHILLLLPETPPSAAAAALARIRSRIPAALAIASRLALFPEHGITTGVLVSALFGNSHEDVPTPISAVRPDLRLQPAPAIAVDGEVAVTGPPDELARQHG